MRKMSLLTSLSCDEEYVMEELFVQTHFPLQEDWWTDPLQPHESSLSVLDIWTKIRFQLIEAPDDQKTGAVALPASLFTWCSDEKWEALKKQYGGHLFPHNIPHSMSCVMLVILECELFFARDGSWNLYLTSPSLNCFKAFFNLQKDYRQRARAPVTKFGHCGTVSTNPCSLHLASSVLISSEQGELFELWCSTHPNLCLGWFFVLPTDFWHPTAPKLTFLTYVLRSGSSRFFPRKFIYDSCRPDLTPCSIVCEDSQVQWVFPDWFQRSLICFLPIQDQYRLSRTNRHLFASFHKLTFHYLTRSSSPFFRSSEFFSSVSPHLSFFSPFGQPWFLAQLISKSCVDIRPRLSPRLSDCSFTDAFQHFQVELCPEGKIYYDAFLDWLKTTHNSSPHVISFLRSLSTVSPLPSSSASASRLSAASASSASSASASASPSPSSASSALASPSSAASSSSWWTYKFDVKTQTFQKMLMFNILIPYKYQQWACVFPKRLHPWTGMDYYLKLFHKTLSVRKRTKKKRKKDDPRLSQSPDKEEKEEG